MNEILVDKKALIYNIDEIKKRKKDENYTIIGVVKGNGYGVGMLKLAEVLKENGINFLAVATVEQAKEIVDANLNTKLLILTPYCDKEILEYLIQNDVILTIDSLVGAKIANEIGVSLNKKVLAHIKIDTGLSRYGFDSKNIEEIVTIIKENENIEFEGIYSHLSNSLAKNATWSYKQYNEFVNVIDKLEKGGNIFRYKHICNSSGFFKYPNMHLNSARIGSAFIGNAVGENNNLKSVATFHSKINKIRELQKGDIIGYGNSYKAKNNIKIAIIPTGYYEGIGISLTDLRFLFKSKLKRAVYSIVNIFKHDMYLNVNNNYYKVLGQIGMNNVVIDITGKDFKENDDVYIKIRPILIDSSVKRVYKD